MFLPKQCPGCGAIHTGRCIPCAQHLQSFVATAPRSNLTLMPSRSGTGISSASTAVLDRPAVQSTPASSVASLEHSGVPRRMVLGLKYRNARHVARELAVPIALSVPDPGLWDVVSWAPTSARRIADRGYDPAELIAREVATLLGLPCRRLLNRSRRSSPQSGRGRLERLAGPRFVSRPLWRAPRVLLIDDVTTTGATLRQGAAALVRAGAAEVRCLAATAAP